MDKNITYKSFGVKAILIEWKPIISEEILTDILSFKSKIESNSKVDFDDFVIGYNSLTIQYKKEYVSFSEEVLRLKEIYQSKIEVKKTTNYLWTIPVCYDEQFGIDLDEVSIRSELSVKEIIQLHSDKIYTVFFIGFLPGFLYLGGLNEKLHFDRKPNPRLKVDKGSVAIGGKQTGIYPFNSPGGWNIIGKTPIDFFDVKIHNPCFAKAGDCIQFKPISKEEFYQIEHKIAQKEYQLSKTLLDD